MKNRKITALVLVTGLALSMLAGCGKKSGTPENNNGSFSVQGNIQENIGNTPTGEAEPTTEPTNDPGAGGGPVSGAPEFSDNIFLGFTYGGGGECTYEDSFSLKVTIYRDGTVVMDYASVYSETMVLSDYEMDRLEAEIDLEMLYYLEIEEDFDVCDGSSDYIYLYGKDDNLLRAVGGYMPKNIEMGEVYTTICTYIDRRFLSEVRSRGVEALIKANEPIEISFVPQGLYQDAEETQTAVTLALQKEEANDIIDTEDWIEEVGLEQSHIGGQGGGYYLESDDYCFFPNTMSVGGWNSVCYQLILYDEYFDEIGTYDFSNYVYPDSYDEVDNPYVAEGVIYAQLSPDKKVIYASVGHLSYASEEPETAFLMAISVEDGAVLWRSDKQIANAYNFVVCGDVIISGYGFTAEDDYVYLTNRYTGEVIDKIKLNSKPDYFCYKDGVLYVRTYDTNYEFWVAVE